MIGSGNLLVVYRMEEYPMRSSVSDHLLSFRRYSGRRCFYLNLGLREVPPFITRIPFQIVIYHTTFLSARWNHATFARVCRRAQPLKEVGEVRIAMPQDEFFRTRDVADFINEFEIDMIFSVAPESEWPKIYAGVDQNRVRFERLLTGYLDEDTVDRVERIAQDTRERSIDIGYRARHSIPWLGRHGLLKAEVASAFQSAAADRDLALDISTRHDDRLLGDDWLRFLGSCKYTIGVEGGASVLDSDGTLKERTDAYIAEHPEADFEEIEANCFPGRDGELQLKALSPRHLEACATRTCQILIEGGYNGILRPGEHYIELKEDFSNLGDVLDTVERDDCREAIVEAAYRDVVESGTWTYARFVSDLERATLGEDAAEPIPRSIRFAALCARNNVLDRLNVARQRLWRRFGRPARLRARRVVRGLPPQVQALLSRLRKRPAHSRGSR